MTKEIEKIQAKPETQMEAKNFFDTDLMGKMMTVAKTFVDAGCFSKDVKNVHQCFIKLQLGYEYGLSPVEAMQSFYFVNGNITPYGVFFTKKLREHGWKIEYPESDEKKCTAIITKGDETFKYTAKAEDVKALNSNAIKFAPIEKLKFHAIGRLVRFHVPEVLGRGGVMYCKEELEGTTAFKNDVEIEEGEILEGFKKTEEKPETEVPLSRQELPLTDEPPVEMPDDSAEKSSFNF